MVYLSDPFSLASRRDGPLSTMRCELWIRSTTATEPPDRKTWNAHADKANAQIKSQGGTGEISFDWTAVDLAQSKEFDIPAAIGNFLNGKMTSDRLRNVTYFEIVWKDSDGVQHVTSRERLPDGTLSLVTTK